MIVLRRLAAWLNARLRLVATDEESAQLDWADRWLDAHPESKP